jgi:CubicO group peptidase (beta-lactamase class C family)
MSPGVGRTATISALAIAAALALALSSSAPHAAQSSDRDHRLTLFTRYLEPLRVQATIPGLSAAIVSGGRILWESGFGYADVEHRVPATGDTPYPVASITKTFASTLLLQCVENGTLDLDQPMGGFSAGFDTGATVRHVLSMTSNPPPGSRFMYDGDRYSTLTAVVDACASTPFRQALRTHVLDRLAMTDSVPGHDLEAPTTEVVALFDAATLARYRAVLARLAKPYSGQSGKAVLADYPPRGINAAAGLVSTVRDLARFDTALDDRVLLRGGTQSLAWRPFLLSGGESSPYGLGWFTHQTAAGRALWHYGLWPTFSSLFLKLPERDATLILLANSDGLSARFPLANGDVMSSPFAAAFIAALK